MNKHGTNILPKCPPPPRVVASFVSEKKRIQSQILTKNKITIFFLRKNDAKFIILKSSR